jgi:hypothetical protein
MNALDRQVAAGDQVVYAAHIYYGGVVAYADQRASAGARPLPYPRDDL